jgi:hypothetical protein
VSLMSCRIHVLFSSGVIKRKCHSLKRFVGIVRMGTPWASDWKWSRTERLGGRRFSYLSEKYRSGWPSPPHVFIVYSIVSHSFSLLGIKHVLNIRHTVHYFIEIFTVTCGSEFILYITLTWWGMPLWFICVYSFRHPSSPSDCIINLFYTKLLTKRVTQLQCTLNLE